MHNSEQPEPREQTEPRLSVLSRQRRPVLALAVALLSCFFLLLAGVQAWSIWNARAVEIESSRIATSNMARALASHAETSIKLADAALAEMVERVERDGLGEPELAHLRARLMDTTRRIGELHGLFVYAPDGRWLVSSLPKPVQGNNFDREYFQYHLTHRDRATHVGVPVRSRSTGVWILPVSRRIEYPDGSFAGVALATLSLDYFGRFYNSFDVGKSGTILLALDDGTLLYRRPFRDEQVGTDIRGGPIMQLYRKNGPVGSAILVSRLDGIERLYSYRHLDGYPLVVASAEAIDEVLAEWRVMAVKSSLLVLSALVLLAWGGGVLLRQIRVREGLEKELRRTSESLKRHNRSLKMLAESDGLTGLANRRLLEDTLERELERARRSGAPFSVILADIDYFKQYNDRYGHVAGDDCLRKVAGAVAAGARRPPDLAARYGGEEFVVVLPDTDLGGARAVAEKIHAAVANLRLAHADSPTGCITISMGVYSGHAFPGRDQDPLAWIEAADRLLYEAKAAGRNRLVAREGQAAAA